MSIARSPSAAVVARRLTKRFGAIDASCGITIELPTTGVCGLLGPNGAGKTTLLRMIAGVLPPDDGELEVLGLDARRHGTSIRAKIGSLPESAPLYPELTIGEYLRYRAALIGLGGRGAREAIQTALERCDTLHLARRCCGTLSKGMQQRVGLAAAIVGDPAIVILDEPSVGLDPAQIVMFRRLVRELAQRRLVLLSSHLLGEVESVCDTIAVMARGRVLVHESIGAFRSRTTAGRKIVTEVDRSLLQEDDLVMEFGALHEWPLADGWMRVEFDAPARDVRADLARALSMRGIAMRSLGYDATGLEDVFIELVRAGGDVRAVSSAGSDTTSDAHARGRGEGAP